MYKELSKEERKSLRFEYEKTKKGSEMTKRLNRLVSEGEFCLLTAIVTLVSIITLKLEWWYISFVLLTLICGVLFIWGQYVIRLREYNNFYDTKYKNGKKQLTKKR